MPHDFTQLSTFQKCPESYRLKYVTQIRKRKEEAEGQPKYFGIGIHAGLEAYYQGKPGEMAARFSAAYPKPFVEDELLYVPKNGLEILAAYPAYAARMDTDWKVLGTEVQGTVDLANGYPYQVKMDLVIELPSGIWFVDHKTTSKSLTDPKYWNSFEPNGQLTGYTAFCQSQYGQCSGGIINAIQLGYRKRAYRGEPPGFHFDFQRQVFNRTPDQVTDWKLRIMRTIDRLESTVKSGLWEKHEGMCSYCEYRDLCLVVGDEQVQSVLYESHDPYQYLKEELAA